MSKGRRKELGVDKPGQQEIVKLKSKDDLFWKKRVSLNNAVQGACCLIASRYKSVGPGTVLSVYIS